MGNKTKYILAVIVLLALLASAGCGTVGRLSPVETVTPVPTPPAQVVATVRPVPSFSHVFVIVMENREYDAVIGAPDAPYINHLATSYGLAAQYYAVSHPSLPNYLAMISGSTQGMTTDCATCSFDAPNLVDQLQARGKTWTAYMEDAPGPCFNGTETDGLITLLHGGGYVRRHNPFIYFDDVRQNAVRCRHVVPLTRFSTDLTTNQTPDFVWVTPNLRHDMHNGSTREGDDWLAAFVPSILRSPAWQNGGVLFIVWDEGTTNAGCCGDAAGGHVPALVIAPRGQPGYRSNVAYTHYSLLRTIEDSWNLGHLGHAADPETHPLADFFP